MSHKQYYARHKDTGSIWYSDQYNILFMTPRGLKAAFNGSRRRAEGLPDDIRAIQLLSQKKLIWADLKEYYDIVEIDGDLKVADLMTLLIKGINSPCPKEREEIAKIVGGKVIE